MTVRIEKSGPVTTVILARPELRNAVDPQTAEALYQAFQAFEADSGARVGVLTGEGGYFCAGYDLKAAAGMTDEAIRAALIAAPPTEDGAMPRGPMGPTRMELSKPVIAAIEGPAVAGGMELALWCDMRIIAETGYFGVYCRRWGVPLIDGGTIRLPRLIGEGRALDLILTGRKVEAEEALRIGLADRIVASGEARSAAEQLAREIARFPQKCLRADRASARSQHGLTMRRALMSEWQGAEGVLAAEGIAGAGRFAEGKGRGGDFSAI